MIDQHTHCPCNGVYLCHTCHEWVHKNPNKAMDLGFIVSRYEDMPVATPVVTVWGTRFHLCDGTFIYERSEA